MKVKSDKTFKKRKSRPFLILPLLDSITIEAADDMPKNVGLKLFTKTWPPKRDNKKDDNSRPLTATLDGPTILDISLIGKIDMSKVRKEFLNITTICRFPLTLAIAKRRRTAVINRPLSLPSTENPKTKRNKRPETGENVRKETDFRGRRRKIDLPKTLPTPKNRGDASDRKKSTISDDNNNNKTFKIPRKRAANVSKLLDVKSDLGNKSTKLPEPCKTCGRPDQPERFHSHPVTPLKATSKKIEEVPKMKSTVQKPVAIKYKSKQTVEKKATPPLPPRKPSLPAQKLVHTPPNVGSSTSDTQVNKKTTPSPQRAKSAKRTLTCYICGREFGTASLHLHEPKCLQKWERENANLPAQLRRKPPQRPDHPLTPQEWNAFAWEASQAILTPCTNCGRTFYFDRLVVHQRSCKIVRDNNNSSLVQTLEKMEDTIRTFEGEFPVVAPIATPDTKLPLKKKIRLIFTNITVEPIVVCFILPSVMASLATQNLNLDKACRVNLQFKEETCDALALRDSSGYNQTDEVAVQKLVATMNAWKNVIQSFIPCLLLMFLGSWSDRHKRRKPCFLGPIIGEMFSCLGLLICTFFYYELSMEYNVFFEAIPPSLTGGWFAMFMAIFSYIGGITSVQTRTLRIGAVNIFANISFTIGNALSGILYKQIGFYGIFSLAVVFYLIGFTYGLFVVKEIPRDDSVPKEANTDGFLKDFFSLKHISETFRVAFRQGERNRKVRICTIMVLCMVIVGPMHGEISVLYLFLRYKYGWNEIDYSIYSTFYVVTHMFGTLFSLILFTKILKVDDAVLGMFSSASRILAAFVYAFAPNSFIFYLGALIEILNGTSFIAMRSIMSKLVPAHELGKINSLFGLSEALVPIIYGPLYSIIYKITINILPGTFFIVGAVLTVPSFFIFGWLYQEHKRDQKEGAQAEKNQIAGENGLSKVI